MKYKSPSGDYDFECLDKWNEPDEVKRLDLMLLEKERLLAKGYDVLWIKTVPIFDIPQK